MKKLLCCVSVVPMRSDASDKSEIVSQMLFGEEAVVLETKNQWLRIKTTFDNYEGWVDEKQFVSIPEEEAKAINSSSPVLSLDLVQLAIHKDTFIPLLLGSTLPSYVAGSFALAGLKYRFDGNVRNVGKEYSKNTVIENGMLYLNAPYLWGGRSPFGIDCSGLTQMAYKLSGVKLWRDARQQSTQGETLSLLAETVPGDLAFFDNEAGAIIHTGILLADQKILHASGKVRIDSVDQQGIYNVEKKKYTHKLRLLKRIF